MYDNVPTFYKYKEYRILMFKQDKESCQDIILI